MSNENACIVIAKFQMDNRICEIIEFYKTSDHKITYDMMVTRGEEAHASMSKEDGEFFNRHKDTMPPTLKDKYFVFPKWLCPYYQYIVFFGYYHNKWFGHCSCPNNSDWGDHRFVLIRFS